MDVEVDHGDVEGVMEAAMLRGMIETLQKFVIDEKRGWFPVFERESLCFCFVGT